VEMSIASLRYFYNKVGITFRRVNLVNVHKLLQPRRVRREQTFYHATLMNVINRKRIYYFDVSYRPSLILFYLKETSVNLWLQSTKSWCSTENPVVLPLQPKRGVNRTILCAIGG
jgi:hypothetical protein